MEKMRGDDWWRNIEVGEIRSGLVRFREVWRDSERFGERFSEIQ